MSEGPILVLLSLGRHPVSGRSRRAERDARALTLALALADRDGAAVVGVHAGDEHASLRDYMGMGLKRLVVLDDVASGDPVAALAAFGRTLAPRMVLAGSVSEAGGGSGLVPYLVAEALGMPLVPSLVAAVPGDQGLELTQALPRGGRRSLAARVPLVATVDLQAPGPRQVAHGPAMRAKVDRRPAHAEPLPSLAPTIVATRPARARPKRIGPAATNAAASKGRQLLIKPSPLEAAEAILKFLEAERLLPRRSPARVREPEETR